MEKISDIARKAQTALEVWLEYRKLFIKRRMKEGQR